MDEEVVRATAQRALESEFQFECSRVAEGGEHEVWYVGSNLVFRAAPNCIASDSILCREKLALDLVRNQCVTRESVPRVLASGNTPKYDRVFTIETRIHGISLEMRQPSEQTEADLAIFFNNLASVPTELASRIGVPEAASETVEELVQDSIQAWAELVASGSCRSSTQALNQVLRASLLVDRISDESPTRVLHGDIKGEHVLVDMETGALRGIIDWSDICIGEVAIDIADLAMAVGRNMARRVAYSIGLTTPVIARAELISQCHAVLLLNDRLLGDDQSNPLALLRTQFRRAFESMAVESAFDHLDIVRLCDHELRASV